MAYYRIYEKLICEVTFSKVIEAASRDEALRLAREEWSEVEGTMEETEIGDIVDGYDVVAGVGEEHAQEEI